MSADLCWAIVRKNSCFLVKSQGTILTKEPNNLTAVNTFKYNGYIGKKTVGVEAAPTGKGVVLSIRRTLGARRPKSAVAKTTISKGSRHAISVIRNTLKKNRYRKDLVDPAVRRACAILRSQKPTVAKKRRTRRKKL